ncbi:MAG: helix-turn-helix domain-containing protein [Novosphingobium sp.]
MSIKIMSAVWEMNLDASQKIVLLALADAANDEGHCWPGMASLAKKCSKSERTVQAMLSALETAGHITRNQVLGRGCNYYIHPRNSCTPAIPAPPQNSRKPPQNLHPTPAKSAPKPSMNHQEPSLDASHPENAAPADKPDGKKAAKAKPTIPDWMPMEAWNGYVAMRNRIRKPLTDRAVKLMVEKLERWRADGHDPGAILDDATEHSWTGLYPPKEDRNAARQQNPDAWRGTAGRSSQHADGFTQELTDIAFGRRPAHG